MSDFCFVQGNTKPYFAVQLLRVEDYQPVDLTGATVTFYMRLEKNTGTTPEVSAGACTITSAALGKVEYRWGANDLNKPGFYTAEFRITFSDTKVQSVIIDHVDVRERLG